MKRKQKAKKKKISAITHTTRSSHISWSRTSSHRISHHRIVRTSARVTSSQFKTFHSHRDLEDQEIEGELQDEDFAGAEDGIDYDDESSSTVECRTAFAYHSNKISESFSSVLDLKDGFTYEGADISWGWSNGPLASSNYAYSMDLYTKSGGVAAGKMTVEFDGHEAFLNVEAGEGLWLSSVRAYVGHAPLPTSDDGSMTIDPSYYPIVHDQMAMSRSFTVNELEEQPIYVVAETTICGLHASMSDAGHASGVRGSTNEDDQSWLGRMFA